MAKIPTRDEYRTRWARLDSGQRRQIVRAVNRGERIDDRTHAALAVRLARNQKGFWAKAWLLGPVASLLTIGDGAVAYLANTLLAVAMLGLMSYFWWRRADRAERRNLARALDRSEDEVTTEPLRVVSGLGSGLLDRLPLAWRLRLSRVTGDDHDGPDEVADEPEPEPGVDYPTEPVQGPGHTPRRKRKRKGR
jgi:hypothetical protein